MSFEIKEKDILGRIGKLKTKSGVLETPLLFPVVNPSVQLITPKRLKDEFGFEAIITNAYILWKRYYNQPIEEGLHKFLKYEGSVMTDSGAYQILVYGGVEVDQPEIVKYQEFIGSDIATILDIPTGWHIQKEKAQETVKETLKRAKDFFKIKTRNDILWVGPVQGGRYFDLVVKSARVMSKLPFQIYALGSPTEVMENYRYDVLVNMIMAAKMNLPIDRPLHLFGAGHPHMMALAVALGCDLFDSAAYALYARENRYMTENGTWRLEEMDYFTCQCPECSAASPRRVLEISKEERERFLAEHNLYVCSAELKRIKQAIRDGRLWEYVEMRAHTHPALLTALKELRKYESFIEKQSPVVKQRGLFFFDNVGLSRPEILHFRNRLSDRYQPPEKANILILIPQTCEKPFHKSEEYKGIRRIISRVSKDSVDCFHVCFYSAPFGVVPLELDEVYPLSQNEAAMPLDCEIINYVANQVSEYIKRPQYDSILLIEDQEKWGTLVKKKSRKTCKDMGKTFHCFTLKAQKTKELLSNIENILKSSLSEKS